MRISAAAMPMIRLAVLIAFVAACGLIFGYLWLGAGGRLPLISDDGYRVSLEVPGVDNLVHGSDVTAAGVEIGKVVEIDVGQRQPRITLQLDEERAPLHEGAHVTVRYKTLLQETFLEVTDGDGPALANGTALPGGSATPSVDLDDLLNSVDAPTKKSLAGAVRSLGTATDGTHRDIASTLRGLGDLGRDGRTALSALAKQSEELKRLTGNSATMLAALDTQQGRIAQLVTDADRLTKVTAEGGEDIRTVMRKLPALLHAAHGAGDGLTRLSGSLGPVAADLRAAAPDLTAALRELPPTARDLRGLLPALDGVLDQAPSTLRRVPVVSSDISRLVPNARVVLGDVNPMLSYLRPYGRDMAAWFANTADATRGEVGGDHYGRFTVPQNEQSIAGVPGGTDDLSPRRNPYPRPGQAEHPAPFSGEYPRVPEGG